ncbi:MAG: acetate--CoA ligase family protein [Anaerolineaceae bacterium]
MQDNLNFFFEPKSVAIIGASSNPNKLSFGILKNLSQYGYKGNIYPINPKNDSILKYPCFESVDDVPGAIDLAVIILPAEAIPEVLIKCGEKGIKACIIISGGFKELGETGKQRELEIQEIAQRYGIRIIGPNCVGNINVYSGLNTTFIKGMPAKGGIGFISQSGAVCGGVVDHIVNEGIGFSHLLSLGNEMDVTETDMIDYLADDPNTSVIAAYVESIRDGVRFLKVASSVKKKKPIVLLKAGKSESGARAVSSHTGSLAGSQTAYSTAFKQAGVIEVCSLRSLLQTAMAFDFQPLPQNNRAVIFTNAGGPAALLSDSLDVHGLKLETISESMQQKLKQKLNPAAQTMNPIDMLGGASEEEYGYAIQVARDACDAGSLLPVLVPQALVNPIAVAESIIQATHDRKRTTLVCLVGKQSIGEAKKMLHQNRIPVYDFPEDVGEVLGAIQQYRLYQIEKSEIRTVEGKKRPSEAAAYLQQFHGKKQIGEAELRPFLEIYGIPNAAGVAAKSNDEAVMAAKRLGYPVVLKIISDEILHKSDVGGIRLNIKDGKDLSTAYRELICTIQKNAPQATIQGVMVEKMIEKGEEIIVGMKRDINFGPLLMIGMGGIYVEAFKDVSFRIAPIGENEIKKMISETVAGKILAGLRGIPYDIEAVISIVKAISQISMDFPEIREIEINPLKVLPEGQGAVALDSRMILE